MPAATIEEAFPQITRDGYRIASNETTTYNCFAWAIGDNQRWWSPVRNKGYHWPKGVPRSLTVDNFVQLYMRYGKYQTCDNANHETGMEKLAIYCNDAGEVTHVARQLSSGKWTSKLGDWEDIEHNTISGIEGQFYGKATKFLKRPV
jgi:hypothetical protein